MKTLLVTGSSGAIGSEVIGYFGNFGFTVHGVDNNLRASFFGPEGRFAASRPFDDVDVTAAGTLHLLEAARRFTADEVCRHQPRRRSHLLY
jgi:nucleoside-diphosphate-sugar epimerase